MRGRHRSTCKNGKKSIENLKKIPGVKTVIIGPSMGGKGLHQAKDGAIKLQLATQGAIKAIMQTSKGVQNISILLEDGIDHEEIKKIIRDLSFVD